MKRGELAEPQASEGGRQVQRRLLLALGRCGKLLNLVSAQDVAVAGAALGDLFEPAGFARSAALVRPLQSRLALTTRDTAWAMSQEQERVVRAAIGAVNEGDLERIVAFGHPEFELELIGGFEHIAGHSMFKGPDGARRFFADWFDAFTTSHAEPTRFLEAGDQLVVLIDLEATGAGEGTDTPVNLSFGAVFTFKEGLIRRLAFYYMQAQALEAAGLRE